MDPAIGELEFEAEENELTLTVDNMSGEWGIFIPQAGDASNDANAADAGNVANGNGQPNGAAAAAEEAGETDVDGSFRTPVAVPGGNAKTDIQFTPSVREPHCFPPP